MGLRSILPWVAIGGLVCGGAALSYFHLSDRLAGEVTRLKRELSALKRGQERGPAVIREVQVAPATPEAGKGDSAVPQAAASAEPAPAELTDEERAAREAKRKRHAEARMALFQTEHANEPEDAEWARAATSRIDEVYSTPEFQALRVTTVCKFTLCRIDVSYSDPEAGPEALKKFAMIRPWDGRRSTKIDLERGEGSSYIVRDGFELPSLDPKTLEN